MEQSRLGGSDVDCSAGLVVAGRGRRRSIF